MEKLNLPDVTIKNNGAITTVFVNGKEIEGVRNIEFSHDREKDSLPVLKIGLLADRVTIDSPVLPDLPETYHGHYVSAHKLIKAGVLTLDRLNELLKQDLIWHSALNKISSKLNALSLWQLGFCRIIL